MEIGLTVNSSKEMVATTIATMEKCVALFAARMPCGRRSVVCVRRERFQISYVRVRHDSVHRICAHSRVGQFATWGTKLNGDRGCNGSNRMEHQTRKETMSTYSRRPVLKYSLSHNLHHPSHTNDQQPTNGTEGDILLWVFLLPSYKW